MANALTRKNTKLNINQWFRVITLCEMRQCRQPTTPLILLFKRKTKSGESIGIAIFGGSNHCCIEWIGRFSREFCAHIPNDLIHWPCFPEFLVSICANLKLGRDYKKRLTYFKIYFISYSNIFLNRNENHGVERDSSETIASTREAERKNILEEWIFVFY